MRRTIDQIEFGLGWAKVKLLPLTWGLKCKLPPAAAVCAGIQTYSPIVAVRLFEGALPTTRHTHRRPIFLGIKSLDRVAWQA